MSLIGLGVPNTIEINELFTAFKIRFDENYSFAGETHDFWELVFVLDGDLGVWAGNKILSLTKGDAILHEPLEFHRLWSEHRTSPTVFVITFSAARMPKIKKRVFEIPQNESERLSALYSSLECAFARDGINIIDIHRNKMTDAEIFVNDLENLLLKMIREYQKVTLDDENNRSKSAISYTDIVRFLETNLEKNLSVDDIAHGCGMSASNLKKTFSKYSGLGIMKYFTMLKVRRAEEYLKNGIAVGEAAAMLGFCDQNYFSTVFKRINGLSPSEYCQNYKRKCENTVASR